MWKQTACQIIRAVRGRQTQQMLARRLGYQANPIRDWEAGRRFPTATEAFRAAKISGVDVQRAFRKFHEKSIEDLDPLDEQSLSSWLNRIRGTTQILDLAARTGQSRYSISRWLKGASRPRLPDFLQLVEAITGRASDLVAELVDIQQVPALASVHQERAAAKNLAFTEPWTEAVMRLLETKAYLSLAAHDVKWVALQLGIEPALAERCISRMLDSGVIRVDGDCLRVSPLTVYTGTDRRKVIALKEHWARVGLQRMQELNKDDWFSYNVMSLSKRDLVIVRELMENTFKEIRSIVAASCPEETVSLIQMQIIDWNVR